MGNSTSSAYDISGDTLQSVVSPWKFNHGFRKEDKEPVAIFTLVKGTHKDRLLPFQRSTLKLKTLRHPYILSYLDNVDLDEELVLVTEGCTPLEEWLLEGSKKGNTRSPLEKESMEQEILWGFKCVLESLQFLHSNGLVHNYLGRHSIFVSKSGDWKIGSLDLIANLTVDDDFTFLSTHAHLLTKPYSVPEREQSLVRPSESERGGKLAVGSAADIYSLACCIRDTFSQVGITVPDGLSKYFTRMMSTDPKRRPTASQLSKCPVFTSDSIKLMASLGDLEALKPAAESLEILTQLSEKIPNLPVSICVHKILPSLARTLQMACTDFNNRDSREACRQSIQLCLSLLSQLSQHGKITEDQYCKQCLASVLLLWMMTDRTVRTALLGTLKLLVALTPADTVNKNIFDPLLAGFSDSNAKMREETLKCLVHVVEKLDEKHLQEKLVRCIVNLQTDTENSIRTNATIFLGRIAPKLKEGVRVRVLCTSFSKAMRDNFIHCRVAGLKAATACLTLMDHGQLTSKVLPQVCSLLLDRSSEVRELALKFLDLGLKLMREQHIVLCATEKKAALTAGESPMKNTNTAVGGSDKDASSWSSSWASLSLTLEKVAIGGVSGSSSGSGSGSGSSGGMSVYTPTVSIIETQVSSSSFVKDRDKDGRDLKKQISSSSSSGSINIIDKSTIVSAVQNKVVMTDGWGDDGGFEDWGDDNGNGSGSNDNDNDNYGDNNSEKGGMSNGWGGDDDIDIGDDDNDDYDNTPNSNSSSSSSSYKGGGGSKIPPTTTNNKLDIPTVTPTSRSTPTIPISPSPSSTSTPFKESRVTSVKPISTAKAVKKPVSTGPSMKLAMTESSDNWDDF